MGTSNAQTNSEQNVANAEANPGGTSIEAFFAASIIFVTGATGFLGKALVEKLLRSCSRISTIYVLIRPKKNLCMEERFKTLLKSSVFDRIRWECPSVLDKIIPIMGDVSVPGLGLSEQDRLLLTQRVNVVIHGAATVRFDEPLKAAVILNTRGTQRILELCSEMVNLVSFVHISTAYSNADQQEVTETVYNTKIEPEIAMDMAENLDDELLSVLEKKLRGKHPNTYTLTKGFAEMLIFKKKSSFPACIVRPSIIGAACQEPFPGWIDNISGITGMLMESGRGRIRSILADHKCAVDIIPIDYVVDTIICAAWYNVMRNNPLPEVYNCVSGTFNPLKWGQLKAMLLKYSVECPSKYAVWYPGLIFTTNEILHKCMVVLFHYFPAFIVDLILKFRGSNAVMLKISKKFNRVAEAGKFFSVNEWKYSNDNVQQLAKIVKTVADGKNFNIDVRRIDWETYIHKYILGIRQYVLKDNPDTITNAKHRLLKFYWLHKFIQISMVFALYKIVIR